MTSHAGTAKWCNYKCLNILCVDWSIADLVMVDCRSNPFPVYGIFTHSQQSRKNHMVKCCLIYDKCINAKRLFFFFFLSGCFKYPLQWTAASSWDCVKILMNPAEDVESFLFIQNSACAYLLVFKNNLKVAKVMILKLLLVPMVSIIIGLSACNELTILMIWLIMALGHQRVL